MHSGLPSNQIGVITPFRAQIQLIKQNLVKFNEIEVHTIDKYQGRDKQVIIISLVRNNSAREVRDFLFFNKQPLFFKINKIKKKDWSNFKRY